jgi:hypothetical protein
MLFAIKTSFVIKTITKVASLIFIAFGFKNPSELSGGYRSRTDDLLNANQVL